jgi:hypothetical protein
MERAPEEEVYTGDLGVCKKARLRDALGRTRVIQLLQTGFENKFSGHGDIEE